MDFEGILTVLVLVWIALGWLGQRGRARRAAEREQLELGREEVQAPAKPPRGPGPRGGTLRQRTLEARRGRQSQFEALREELERQLGLRAGPESGPLGRRSTRPVPGAEEVEDTEVLEVAGEREAVSLEEGWERPERALSVRDAAEAEILVRRRLRQAEARLQGRTRADHAAFDAKVRAVPPPAAARPAALQRMPLRQAVIWREILGPPKALDR